VQLLEAYSVSHGKASAWLPVLELLRGYFGIEDRDDAASRREKIRASLTALDPALEDALPYLASLLGIVEGADPLAQMDAQIKRQRTLEAINRVLLRETVKQPLVAIFEDLHWIDGHTQALLDSLADSIASARLLLLVNYRPEYRHNWGNKSCYSQLRLDTQSSESAQEMLDALLPRPIASSSTREINDEVVVSEEGARLAALKRLIIERTGGNPFFIEEMVQALFEDGALVRNGIVKATRSLSALRLPPTVQGILASRIDRLSAAHKDLLQTMAVIGRESPLTVLRQVVRTEAPLEDELRVLRASEFIYEQPAAMDTEYVFRHALTQEVAYSSLLLERCKQLHERIGDSIETLFADKLDDQVDALAHHYSHSENADKAIEYLGRAGQQALRRSAHDQAIRKLNESISRLLTLPDSSDRQRRELSFQIMLAPALIALTGWGTPEVGRTSARARELCTALGDPPELFGVLYGSWSLRLVRAEMQTAHHEASRLLALAEDMHDRAMLQIAHGAMGMTLFHMGESQRAAGHFRSALSLDDPARPLAPLPAAGGIDPVVSYFSYQSWVLWHLGYPEQALKSALQAVARAHTLSHPHTSAFSEWISRKLEGRSQGICRPGRNRGAADRLVL
jgi:predicted ATPase